MSQKSWDATLIDKWTTMLIFLNSVLNDRKELYVELRNQTLLLFSLCELIKKQNPGLMHVWQAVYY